MSFEIFLSIGTVVMLLTMFIVTRYYDVKTWKWILITFLLTGAGVLGTKVMFFIENGNFSGRSFYGAIFFTPLIMLCVALLLKIPGRVMLDLCAPCECAMLILMKINCAIEGCCFGCVVGVDEAGYPIRFPSQIVECICAAILCLCLLLLIKNGKHKGTLYYWFMILYGCSRFVLNFFRNTDPFLWIMPAGHLWSLVSIGLGLMFMTLSKRKSKIA